MSVAISTLKFVISNYGDRAQARIRPREGGWDKSSEVRGFGAEPYAAKAVFGPGLCGLAVNPKAVNLTF